MDVRRDEPLIRVEAVTKEYVMGGEVLRALNEVSLTVGYGEFVTIIGPSGSGKSTLMNILGCLDHPSEGTYTVGGRDTHMLDSDELAQLRREHFGFVFQRYHLLPHVDVVVVTLPLTDATAGLVDASFLAALPDGALVVNVGRGKVVDTDALVAELSAGRLRAARALQAVFERQLVLRLDVTGEVGGRVDGRRRGAARDHLAVRAAVGDGA